MEERFMERAIALAKKGQGYTRPNPLVGAVIVKEGRVIGEGYHKVYGGAHAEINALNHAREEVAGATLYVTLEPCAHYGKTPPCVDAIIDNKIKKVVIGMEDPNPLVKGQGIKRLEDHGIQVITGVLDKEIWQLNEIFIKYILTQHPFVLIKTAMTLDGKIATTTGNARWISNASSRAYVHQLRHQMSSIMVGIGTVLKDDPQLTTRLDHQKGRDPMRIIVDTQARIPLEAKVLNLISEAKTLIATSEKADKDKLKALEEKGAEILTLPIKGEGIDLEALMLALGQRQMDSVLVEGGGTLNYSLLKEGLVDKMITMIAPKVIGGRSSKTPVEGEGIPWMKEAIQLHRVQVNRLDEDIMIEGYLKEGITCLQD